MVTPIDDMELRLDYRPDVFDEQTAHTLVERLVRVLSQVAAEPDLPVAKIEVLDEAERQRLVADWNDTSRPLPAASIPALIERQVALTPDAIALVSDGTELSYAELNERANRLAYRLIEQGVGQETLVGLVFERSADLVVALFAVIKAGGAYVPLDGRHPVTRLQAIAAEAGVSTVLVDQAMADRGLAADGLFGSADILLVTDNILTAGPSPTNPQVPVLPANLMYVMYTSGSTGTPKGVAATYGGVLAFCLDACWRDDIVERVLVQANHAFDASTYEIWVPLVKGGRLVIVPPGEVDAIQRGALIADQQVTNVHATSGLFRVLAEQTPHIFAGVREVSTGGDVVSANAVRTLLATHPGLVVRSTYGPTETTAFTTQIPFTTADLVPDSVPIGVPMDNTRVFVLDDFLRPVPAGMTGELYVASAGLARGYAGCAALTAERFVACPFPVSGDDAGPGDRMYRTGDLARWTKSGELVFDGRADEQLKIRGFRIEPAEIENVLTSHEAVGQAAVVAREDQPGIKRLAAYVVPANAHPADGQVLRDFLATRLPEYMVPVVVTVLDALPVTANGKLDRAQLPAPALSGRVTSRDPATPMEELLCGLFAEVLSLDRVGAEDSFFELGGDSIMSMLVVSRARRAGVLLTPRQVFELRTPAALARVAGEVTRAAVTDSEPDVATGTVPLTPVMRELAELTGSAERAGSQSMLLNVPADLTLDRLEAAVQAIVNQHDLLRARLDTEAGQLEVPDVAAAGAITAQQLVRRVAAAGLTDEARRELLDEQAAAAQDRLDPAAGVMVQLVWLDAGQAKAGLLLIVAHHLVIDGVSWRILVPDLAAAYAALASGLDESVLEPEGTSFRRWASELTAQASSQAVVGELPVWMSILTGSEPLLGDRALDPQLDTMAKGLARAPVMVPTDVAAALLTAVPAAFHAGADDVLLAGLAAALDEWLRARGRRLPEGVLVEMEGHGRVPLTDEMDLTRTVGWFTTVYPVRLDPGPIDFGQVRAGGPDAGRLIKRVKEKLRLIPGDGLGYGMLRYLNPATGPVLAARPAPQLGFNYLGRFAGGGEPADAQAAEANWHPAGDTALRGGVDAEMPVRHALEASGSVRDLPGGLEMRLLLEAPIELIGQQALADLAAGWLAMLSGLVTHTITGSGGGYTPSDFSLISLGQDDIEEFESAFDGGAVS